MDKGYDTNWFSEFIIEKRGKVSLNLEEGTDVDVWGFDELK